MAEEAPKKYTEDELQQLKQRILKSWIVNEFNHKPAYDAHQNKFKEFSMTVTINFQCAISQQLVEDACMLTQCMKDKKHFDAYYDLGQLLTYFNSTIPGFSTVKSVKCPTCKSTTTVPKIEMAFAPHVLVQELKKKCGLVPKTLNYVFEIGKFIPQSIGSLSKFDSDHSQQIMKILAQPTKQDQQFLVRAKEKNELIYFYNICLLGQMRITIPVRGKQCKHFECFDLVYLLKHLKDKNKTTIQCPKCGNFVSKDSLQIDYDLFNTALQSYDFSFAYKYYPQQNELVDVLIELNVDNNISAYRLFPNQEDDFNFRKTIYQIVDKTYNQTKNHETTEKFYQTATLDQLELIRGPFTDCRVEIPCRCVNCKKLQVCDLRFMACVIWSFQNQSEKTGIKKQMISCPLCDSPFVPKKGPKGLPLFEQIYVDTDMMNFINQTMSFAGLNLQKYIQFRKGEQSKQLKIIDGPSMFTTCKAAMVKLSLKCAISGKIITKPVRGEECTHNQPFDDSIISAHYNSQIDLYTLPCPLCQKSLKVLVRDLEFGEALQEFYSKQIQQCEEVSIQIQKRIIRARNPI